MIESVTFCPQAVLLWSDRQVATAIGMNVKRVQELARSGALPAFKIGKELEPTIKFLKVQLCDIII